MFCVKYKFQTVGECACLQSITDFREFYFVSLPSFSHSTLCFLHTQSLYDKVTDSHDDVVKGQWNRATTACGKQARQEKRQQSSICPEWSFLTSFLRLDSVIEEHRYIKGKEEINKCQQRRIACIEMSAQVISPRSQDKRKPFTRQVSDGEEAFTARWQLKHWQSTGAGWSLRREVY